MHNGDTSLTQPKYQLQTILKRVLSLGVASRKLFAGITNCFVISSRTLARYLVLFKDTGG
jgi:hypothetical protein